MSVSEIFLLLTAKLCIVCISEYKKISFETKSKIKNHTTHHLDYPDKHLDECLEDDDSEFNYLQEEVEEDDKEERRFDRAAQIPSV